MGSEKIVAKEDAAEKVNIVLFAAKPDQEFAVRRPQSWNNAFDPNPPYQQQPHDNVYHQVYGDGRHYNVWVNQALETPKEVIAEKETRKLGEILNIRRDGFVHNRENEAVFYADPKAVALLNSLRGSTIGEVRLGRPDVTEALMI
jgi:hypothetical protein